MKSLTIWIAASAILVACDAADPVRSTTMPPINVAPPTYVLSGIVRDETGSPLPGARAEIVTGNVLFLGRSTTTDGNGVFSFAGVWGEMQVRVEKAGYHINVQTVVVSADIGIDVRLARAVLPSATPSDTIQVGNTIRAITNQPPCDPTRWDDLAPCRRFDFASTSPGRLVITIAYIGTPIDATFVSAFSGVYLDVSQEVAPGEIILEASVGGYERYEIRVNSYYEPQEFNLRAEFFPSGQ